MQTIADIHNHIIFDVDDGPPTLEDSMRLLRQAAKYHITDIAATPHQLEKDQVSNVKARQEKVIKNFRRLQEEAEKEKLPLRLHLGAELFFTTGVVRAPQIPYFTYGDKKKYALIEFSMNWPPQGFKEAFYELIQDDCIPVLAHPARYSYFWEIAEDITDLVRMGTLLQINAGSLLGYMGTQARFISEMLLKGGLVHVIASDAHRESRAIGFNLTRAAAVYKEKYPDINIDRLISDNPMKILRGETIEVDEEPCYRFDKKKQYKQWRRFHFVHDILGIGDKTVKKAKKTRRYI